MKESEIIVFEYINNTTLPIRHTVNALCVGGNDGVFATFLMPDNPDIIGLAGGDDGHWKLIGSYNVYWGDQILESLKTTIENAQKQTDKLYKIRQIVCIDCDDSICRKREEDLASCIKALQEPRDDL